MIFSSVPFIFAFLPLALLGVYLCKKYYGHTPLVIYWLLGMSFAFYGYWKVAYLPLFAGSVIINWIIGEKMRPRRSRSWLITGLVFNLSLIGYYKYANFFLENFRDFTGLDVPHLNVILPLAISFFTFQQIAYQVDTYNGKTEKIDLFRYAFFIAVFPHLIAGPIVHYRYILPYTKKNGALLRISASTILHGLVLFSVGFFKKVAIADNVSAFATPFFQMADAGQTLNFPTAAMATLAYTFQLYYDFSGYSDMAIGIALMFNMNLPLNFNSPYKSTSIIEFWRRWHMTLSEFLRDYLYIPLGGNRKGPVRRYINLMLTMLLGGLWHGASWNFVLWGGIHGTCLAANHGWRSLTEKHGSLSARWLKPLYLVVTFTIVILAWIPFRAETWDGAVMVYKGLFSGSPVKIPQGIDMAYGWAWIAAAAAIAFLAPNAWELRQKYETGDEKTKMAFHAFSLILFIISSFMITFVANRTTEFIYFNF